MFPAVQDADTQSGLVSVDSSSWTLTYPTNLQNGDLILLVAATDDIGTPVTLPADWVSNAWVNGISLTHIVGKKKSDGTETGNFTLTLNAVQQGCWRVLRITDWEGTLGTTFDDTNATTNGSVTRTAAEGASTTPNPPLLNPSNWGSADTLWIVAGFADNGDSTFTGFPTNYTNTSAQESGGASGAALGVARRAFAAESEDPGDFTIDLSEQWITTTIAIRPGAVSPPNLRITRSNLRW
jgi:hypothetical protein